MLKKKKTTASGKLVLVKSVRRHWTSGGCPFSAPKSRFLPSFAAM